ncbi:MAG: TolC family protein, partial [Blastocatellia bacterium]
NPTVTFGAEQFDFGHPLRDIVRTNSNTAANRVYTFRWDQLIERGSKRDLRAQAASAQLGSAEAQVLDTTRQQLFQLKQAFYNAVLARENLRVADENLYLINNTEQLIKLHVDAGDTAEWELIKFQANKVQYQHDQVSSGLTYQQSVRDLLNLLGAQPSNVAGAVPVSGPAQLPQSIAQAPIDVVGDLASKPVNLDIAPLEQIALSKRPDVIAAQRAVDAAQKNWELALSLRHRDIDIAGEYQREGGENTFGVTVSIPVFVHNNHSAEIAAAAAQLQQAKSLLEQVKLQTLTDTDKAYRAYEISRQMLGIYSAETLAKAEESFHIAGVSYKEGSTSLLELQDAQRTYN